ncbi:chemotaxis protein CheA [Caldichromatium japonicum]|uniref:Chemotaxis protein CheA n=1 Tax=Caldichromatium japonicum TaxID=2699430 RepID=A0A6G7VAH0_9GAMM|nr:chemotaxis protein CheA [Caldichromatium japonicum]QIK36974.1 chemotaxis protein CheA [Caldichromatium japonicum]
MSLDSARQAFVAEVSELLQSMEDALLALEQDPKDPESLNAVFRAMHTIKGTAGVFGYEPIVAFTHAVEGLMERVRSGQIALTPELIAALLECRDHTDCLVAACLSADLPESPLDPQLIRAGESLLERLGQGGEGSQTGAVSPGPEAKHLPVGRDLWMISLRFTCDAFRHGIDPLSFLRYLASLGELVHVAVRIDPGAGCSLEFDPETCYLQFGIGFRGDVDKPLLANVFEFADQDCEIRILEPDTAHAKYLELLDTLPPEQVGCIGELLVRIGALTQAELERALTIQEAEGGGRKIGEILVEQGSIKAAVVEQAAQVQAAARNRVQEEARFIRVDAQRLGHLIDLIGELVTSSAAIRVLAKRAGIEALDEVVDGVDYLVSEIRDQALQLRMVPIGDTFSRFKRVVRDAAQELGKQIELVINGAETELDKTVVEKMVDPLTHLVRNAIDHGIEPPEVRLSKGKPAQGTIVLNAYHDSGHIVIEIADDGAGLDAAKIRAKAEALGLVRPDESLTREEALRLIFAPGLSTKEQATNLSGRGVGMDVVKRNIEALRGTIELESEPGQGTRFTISLPLTLAIIDGFMVGAGGGQYVIPLAQVVECVELDLDQGSGEHGYYINLRGEVLPFIRLTELFGAEPTAAHRQRESLVVVRFGHHKIGLVVDALHGELQAVIKPLGRIFERLTGIAGATILGTGEVALILDVSELAALSQGLHQYAVDPASIHG